MLIIAPASESKRPPGPDGAPVDLDALSFPELTPTRRRMVDALAATSGRPDAFRRLGVGPSKAPDVARNTWLLETAAIPVSDLYIGPLHDGLDLARLSEPAAARAARGLVVTSALWGLLRPSDRIPSYRLQMHASLVGIDRIDATWRTVLPETLAEAAARAGGGMVLDLRSASYQAMGLPARLADRTVALKVDQGPNHRVGDVIAKRVRGEAAHRLLESGVEPPDPDGLAEVLSGRWPVRLAEPERAGTPWTMTLRVDG